MKRCFFCLRRSRALLLLSACMTGLAVQAQDEAARAQSSSGIGFPRRGTVTAKTLNVRARPGLFYEVVAKLEGGETIDVLRRQNQWYQIAVPADAQAWVSARFVGEKNRITGNGVRVRAGAGVAFTPYHTLDEGSTVRPSGEVRNEWIQIHPPADAEVWVSSQFVELEPPPAASATQEELADNAQESSRPVAKVAEGDEKGPGGKMDPDPEQQPSRGSETLAETGGTEDAESENPKEGRSQAPEKGSAEVVDLREGSGLDRPEQARDLEMLPPIRLDDEGTGRSDAGGQERTPAPPSISVQQRDADSSAKESGTLPFTRVEEAAEDKQSAPRDDKARRGEAKEQRERQERKPKPAVKQRVPELPAAFQVSGTVVSLGERANKDASHVVLASEAGRTQLIAYLQSSYVDLSKWEGRKLHVYGKRIPCNWSRPLVAVKGLLLFR